MSISIIIVTSTIRALMVEKIVRDNIRDSLDYRDFYHTTYIGTLYSQIIGCSIHVYYETVI